MASKFEQTDRHTMSFPPSFQSDALPHFLNPGDFVVDLVDSEEDVWAGQGDGEVVKVEGVKVPVLRYKAEELEEEEEEEAFVAVLQMRNITQVMHRRQKNSCYVKP